MELLREQFTYVLIEIVTRELYGRIRHYPHAVRAIASHKAFESFVLPHLHQSLGNRQLVLILPSALYLEENFQSLERRDYCSGDRTSNSSCNEGGNNRLSDGMP